MFVGAARRRPPRLPPVEREGPGRMKVDPPCLRRVRRAGTAFGVLVLVVLSSACGGGGSIGERLAMPEAATTLSVPPAEDRPPGTPADAGAALPVELTRATGPARTATRPAPRFDPAAVALTLTEVATDLSEPIGIQSAPDGSGRLFVLAKAGRIRLIKDGELLPTPFLDLRGEVGSGASEQGLLGLAFHPRYGNPVAGGRFYVNYTDKGGDTVLAEYRVSEDADVADPDSERVLLQVGQPAANHNGGDLAFGPDGYLYVALGDGGPSDRGAGSAADGRSGDPDTLLGSILRLDVDRGEPYGIPPDNPFTQDGAMRDEIWAYGLRNPWRISFDRVTGDLYIADVGPADWEEVNRQAAGAGGGADYGWPTLEGNHCRGGGEDCQPPAAARPPILEYSHDEGGCAITGGYVYRGELAPALRGAYLFGDYCSGRIWAGWRDEAGSWQRAELDHTDLDISSFGQGEDGELYVADKGGGKIYRLGAESPP